jgi:two-component system OmpR family response regulator
MEKADAGAHDGTHRRGQRMAKEERENRTVLVIDEDVSVLDTTRSTLEASGYRVIIRDRSAGSISAIVKEKPDVVLVELNMARLNGETIVKILNKTHPRPNVIVLFHSALPVESLRLRALAAGAQGYVPKTDNGAELIRRIEHCVATAGSASKSRLAAMMSEEPQGAAAPIDRPPSSSPRRAAIDPSATLRREGATGTARSAVKTLFVDDDWSLLRSYRSALGSELQAEFLTTGDEAMNRLLSDAPPDIVVCDIVMPYVTGAELYNRAVAADPSWADRFLFLTGASTTRVVIDFLNEHEGRVLFKPVPSNRLLDSIRKMESSARPRSPYGR